MSIQSTYHPRETQCMEPLAQIQICLHMTLPQRIRKQRKESSEEGSVSASAKKAMKKVF